MYHEQYGGTILNSDIASVKNNVVQNPKFLGGFWDAWGTDCCCSVGPSPISTVYYRKCHVAVVT